MGTGYTLPRRTNQWFEEGEREVDNPHAHKLDDPSRDKSLPPEPKTHIVKSNIRETAIEYLFARNKIDKDHKDAADWFRQRCYEACIDSLPVSDVERVSGTLWAHTAVTDQAVTASKELATVQKKLGPVFFSLLTHTCAVGYSIGEVANRFLFGTEPGTNAHEAATAATTKIIILALDQLVLTLRDELIRTPRGSISKKSHFYKNFSRGFGTLSSDPKLWMAVPDKPFSDKNERKRKGRKK